MTFDPADVLIHVREPYNKNTLWILPINGTINVNVYDSGWKTIFSTQDKGLSSLSLQLVKDLVNSLNSEITDKLIKQFNKLNTTSLTLVEKNKKLESKISELDDKVEKLTKRYSTLMSKLMINKNGR